MFNFTRLAIAAAALVVVACTTGRPNAPGQPNATASLGRTAAPSASTPSTSTEAPRPPSEGPLAAGTYAVTPFLGGDTGTCGPVPTQQTAVPCPDATRDDSIRFTFTVPDGWAGAPFQGLWLVGNTASPPGGAGMHFGRGYWLYSDPCRTPANVAGMPDISVGPTVDDFANALAAHPVLEVTTPVDVTLAGYAGKYVDLQVPADISACDAFWPWEGGRGLYAQGPGHQWHIWILDVDGVRVVIQTGDYAGTAPQRQTELAAIVDSIQITP